MTKRLILLFILLLSPASAEWVRFFSLQPEVEAPLAFHSEQDIQAPRQRLSRADWELYLAGKKATLREEEKATVAELKTGKKIWFFGDPFLTDSVVPLSPREEKRKYWWNDLLDDLKSRGYLSSLKDETATEMSFQLPFESDLIMEAAPEILARRGLLINDSSLFLLKTDTVEEEYPGVFNPPFRRYSLLLSVTDSTLNIKATVSSFRRYPNTDLYGWQPDKSPSIRQRIRETAAEIVLKLAYPSTWAIRLADYKEGQIWEDW